jgi:exopolyphosphatase/guanosine-5'-triphosphate,3'-diphosphate pyrophosphatase
MVLANSASHAPNIAALDLGTNSCRLLIASIGVTNLHRNFFKVRVSDERRIKIIDSFAKIISLGEGVKQTGMLSNDAMERTIIALRACKKKLDNHRIYKMRAVATEACRQANNAKILLERVSNEIGVDLEIISPQEEARLVLKGCSGVISDEKNYGILLDIGGGSTEVVWLRISKGSGRPLVSVIDSISLPFGVVTINDTYTHGKNDQKIYSVLRENISNTLIAFMAKNNIMESLKLGEVQVVTSSGTTTTLGSLTLGLNTYDRSAIDGKDFSSQKIIAVGEDLLSRYLLSTPTTVHLGREKNFITNKFFDHVSDKNSAEFKAFAYNRMGLLASGVAIINAILATIGDCPIRIADRGVREGILFDLMDSLRTRQSTSWNF